MQNTSPLEYWLSLKLGESATEIELETRADNLHALDLMVSQVTRSINIFSRHLDTLLYDRTNFLDTLSQLCSNNRSATIRILIQDPATTVNQGHRLIELSRKLSSSFELRKVHEDYHRYNEAFFIADDCGLIDRPMADRYEGTANFNAVIEVQRKLDLFTEIWERSQPDPDLRRLYL